MDDLGGVLRRVLGPYLLTLGGGVLVATLLMFVFIAAIGTSNSSGATCGNGGAATGPGSFPSTSATLPQEIKQRISQNQSAYQSGVQGTSIPWQMMAAIHYREASNDPNRSMFAGEPLGSINPDHGVVEGKTLAENAHLAAETLSGLGRSVYGDTFTSTLPVVAEYAVAYNRGSLYKNAGVSPLRSPYAMNFFDAAHQNMSWMDPPDTVSGVDSNLGAVTVYSILINQGTGGGGSCGGSSSAPSGGTTTPAEILSWVDKGQIVLANPVIRSEIQNILTQNTLNLIGAIHNKGYTFQINAAGPQSHPTHCGAGGTSLHCVGRAIDINSGPGVPVHPGNVFQLQKWLYDNRQQLKLQELFGPDPNPCGNGCLSNSQPSGNYDNGESLHVGVQP